MRRKALLLDTHVLIWMDQERQRIPQAIWSEMDAARMRFYSAASAWEAAIKRASSKLQIYQPLSLAAVRFGLRELPVTVAHGEVAGSLPLHHKDPFDRLMIAQAQVEDLILVTPDRFLQAYDVELLLV